MWHLSAGGVEVWHGVAFLYRDTGWGTPEPVVVRRSVSTSARAFRIRCTGYFPTKPRIDFELELIGSAAGVVRVAGAATPRGDIDANRLGLCVMHPMTAGGRRVDVLHVDGRHSASTFPQLIPAWPPFTLVRAMRHEYAPGCWATCTFEGDDFEVEDQRNNSDPSFKTYSRSNMMPRPYVLRRGIAIRQAVELRLSTALRRAARARYDGPVTLTVERRMRALPSVGVAIGADDTRAGTAALEALRALRPRHLHLAIAPDGSAIDWRGVRALLDAAGARLRLDVTPGNEATAGRELRHLRDDLRRARVGPESVAVFAGAPRVVDVARRLFPRAAVGGGTPHFFVQLNRAEQLGDLDFLTFTTCPIVHGADDESVMATLSSLPSMCSTLRDRFPGARLRIGPSGIAARQSPLGRQPASDGTHRIALARRDPRCRGVFGAAWLVGYVAALVSSDVDALTLASLAGDDGLTTPGSRRSYGTVPAFHALACLRGMSRVRAVQASDPVRIAALAGERNGTIDVLVANLTARTVDVLLPGAAPRDVVALDARSWQRRADDVDAWRPLRPSRHAGKLRIALDAYGVARVASTA